MVFTSNAVRSRRCGNDNVVCFFGVKFDFKSSIATVTVATPCDKLILICRTILFPEYFTLGVGKKKEPGYEALCRTS